MLAPNTNTKARCTGDDETPPRPGTRPVDAAQCAVEDTSIDGPEFAATPGVAARGPKRLTYFTYLLSPGTQGRTDKNLCRCFGAPARRVFPDHLITYCRRSSTLVRWKCPPSLPCLRVDVRGGGAERHGWRGGALQYKRRRLLRGALSELRATHLQEFLRAVRARPAPSGLPSLPGRHGIH